MTLIKNHIYQYLHGPAVKKCQVPMFFKYLLLLPLILHLNQRLATFIKTTAQLKKRSRPTFIQNLVFFVDTLIGTIRWSQLSPPPSSTRPQVDEALLTQISFNVTYNIKLRTRLPMRDQD